MRVGSLGNEADDLGTIADDIRSDRCDWRHRGDHQQAAVVFDCPRIRRPTRRTPRADAAQMANGAEAARHPSSEESSSSDDGRWQTAS